MVPHSMFVPSDRHVDLTLKLLHWIVSGALLASLAWSALMWLRPAAVRDRGDVGPPAWAAMTDVLMTPRLDFDFHLPQLPTIYRCEHHGEVTYSDRPCIAGRMRALSLRPS
jgi:hypothetical protein